MTTIIKEATASYNLGWPYVTFSTQWMETKKEFLGVWDYMFIQVISIASISNFGANFPLQ